MTKDLRKFFVFILGGGLGALINLAVTYFLTEIIGIKYLVSYILGVSLNIIFNFLYHRAITFKVKNKTSERMVKSAFSSLFIGFGIMAMVYFFTEILSIWYILSGILSIGIMTVANYILNKMWVFESCE